MAKRFVCIWFPFLLTDHAALRQPDYHTIPLVITEPDHGRLLIKALNSVAQNKGIIKGMVLADAKAIVPSIKKIDYREGLTEKLLHRMAQWSVRFTPFAAVQLPDGIVLDASGCAHLWGGEAEYLADITRRFKQKGFHARTAMADTVGAAWGIVRFAKLSGVIPPGQHMETLLPLPPQALRLDLSTIEKLYKLGFRQNKNFMFMHRMALRRRFGDHIILRINQALGLEEENLQPVHLPQQYQERLPCLDPIRSREGIEIALQQLLETSCNRLKKEGKGLREANFTAHRVDNAIQKISINTGRPSHNVKHLFHLFELKLDRFEPALGFELFLLEASKVEELDNRQEALWKEESGLLDQQLAELMDRLSSRLGQQSMMRFLPDEHWWPERSVKPAGSLEETPSTEWRKDRQRPVHLLPLPEPVEVTAPIPDYPPMLFRYKGELHKIVKADGPERIEKEWWIEEGEHRDYYSVEDEQGSRYWLFRSGHYEAEKKGQWFLHGYFA